MWDTHRNTALRSLRYGRLIECRMEAGMNEYLSWSREEKIIARKAFDRALTEELQALIRKTKELANKIEEPSQLWSLEYYLQQRRKEIDRKYDYRYSQLPMVFGFLIREGKVTEQELGGLREDKLELIRKWSIPLKPPATPLTSKFTCR